MTAAQLREWERARVRVARLQPNVGAAVLQSFARILAALPESTVARIIAEGATDRILTVLLAEAVLERATMPVRFALRDAVERSFRLNVPYLPRGGRIDGTIAVLFDHLNPRVTEALRTLETRVVSGLHESVRETVRQTITRGVEEQRAPAAIARTVRDVVGLSPRQEAAVANFRALLESGDREALSRVLRDKRFDRTLDRAIGADGKGLSSEQIDSMTAAYRKRSIARNAETISRTATQDAYKIAQRESWQSAIDRGIIEPGRLMREWIGVNDERERPSHVAMNNTVVPFDQLYPNGQRYPGEGEFNCRCIDRFFIARA